MSPELAKKLRGTPQFIGRMAQAITSLRNEATDAELEFDPDDVQCADFLTEQPPVRAFDWKSLDGRVLHVSVVYEPRWLESLRA